MNKIYKVFMFLACLIGLTVATSSHSYESPDRSLHGLPSNLGTSHASNLTSSYPLIKIDKENMLVLRGQVTSQSASKIINEMLTLKSKEMYLYIDSPGGSVLAGLEIVQVMESLQQAGVKIYTIAANAASIGVHHPSMRYRALY